MNDSPAFESRRVRTQPRRATRVPTGTRPFRIEATLTCSAVDIAHNYLSVIPFMTSLKIGLVSLGCPKNLVDSEVMLGLAQQAGHELTNDPSAADVLVVNTCAFIDSAKQESIDTILEMAQHKKDGACRRLIVTGCLAERYRDDLKAQIPEIDAVLGTGEVPEIVGAIEARPQPRPGAAPLPFFRARPVDEI